MVRPAAAAEVELGGGRGARVAGARGLAAERALVRNGDGRVDAAAADGVVAGVHWEQKERLIKAETVTNGNMSH